MLEQYFCLGHYECISHLFILLGEVGTGHSSRLCWLWMKICASDIFLLLCFKSFLEVIDVSLFPVKMYFEVCKLTIDLVNFLLLWSKHVLEFNLELVHLMLCVPIRVGSSFSLLWSLPLLLSYWCILPLLLSYWHVWLYPPFLVVDPINFPI